MEITAKDALKSNLLDLRDRLNGFYRQDTRAQGFPGTTPSTGHCAAVSVIIHGLFGGEMVSTLVMGHSHWLNRLKVGGRSLDVDLTGDQFGYAPLQIEDAGKLYPDTRVRRLNDLTKETLTRAKLLADRAGLLEAVRAIDKLSEIPRTPHRVK